MPKTIVVVLKQSMGWTLFSESQEIRAAVNKLVAWTHSPKNPALQQALFKISSYLIDSRLKFSVMRTDLHHLDFREAIDYLTSV